ncbi:hypothetical protein J4Q44_G00250840, partial [Coregonus suidteri]
MRMMLGRRRWCSSMMRDATADRASRLKAWGSTKVLRCMPSTTQSSQQRTGRESRPPAGASNAKTQIKLADVPSIFSSKYLGFLDPQEKLFGERTGGFRWSLEEEEDKETLLNLQDQFQPFRDVVKLVSSQRWKDVIQEEQHFKGTLFRFPLRSEASEISDNLYDSDKVVKLFDSFIADADISTLFLRNVSSVSLQHINTEGSVNVRLTVTSSPTVNPGLKTRNESNIDGSTCFKTITSTSEGKKQTKTKWLVTTCCMKEGNVPELDSLAKKLSFRPQVDLAFRCSQESVLTDGRLSVFLPL